MGENLDFINIFERKIEKNKPNYNFRKLCHVKRLVSSPNQPRRAKW